jgi:hypothetical protein
VFAAELGALDVVARARLLDALYLGTSAPAWEALRHDRALSVAQSADVVRRTVGALLTSTGGPS